MFHGLILRVPIRKRVTRACPSGTFLRTVAISDDSVVFLKSKRASLCLSFPDDTTRPVIVTIDPQRKNAVPKSLAWCKKVLIDLVECILHPSEPIESFEALSEACQWEELENFRHSPQRFVVRCRRKT